jgi:hypothetical protein
MKGPRNLIILLQSGTAAQDLWKPELADSRLHVANLSLRWSWGFDPLRRLSSDAANHIGVGEGLRRTLGSLDIERGWNWLGYARVQRRRSARDDQVAIMLIAGSWPAITVSGPRADKGRVVVE